MLGGKGSRLVGLELDGVRAAEGGFVDEAAGDVHAAFMVHACFGDDVGALEAGCRDGVLADEFGKVHKTLREKVRRLREKRGSPALYPCRERRSNGANRHQASRACLAFRHAVALKRLWGTDALFPPAFLGCGSVLRAFCFLCGVSIRMEPYPWGNHERLSEMACTGRRFDGFGVPSAARRVRAYRICLRATRLPPSPAMPPAASLFPNRLMRRGRRAIMPKPSACTMWWPVTPRFPRSSARWRGSVWLRRPFSAAIGRALRMP